MKNIKLTPWVRKFTSLNYRSRWVIEGLFRSFKTNQFNIESTGITDPFKLRNLIHGLMLCFCCVLHHAQYLFSKFPIPVIIKPHGYPANSYGRSLFDRFRYLIFDPITSSHPTVYVP